MKKQSVLFVIALVVFSAGSFAHGFVNNYRIASSNDTAINAKSAVKSGSNIILSFKGVISNSVSKLHWITEDEHGMKSFTIERSINNRDFYPVAIMPAMNEKGQLVYEYPDKDISRLSAQTFSYRLKITDADDKDSYSQVIILSADKNASVAVR